MKEVKISLLRSIDNALIDQLDTIKDSVLFQKALEKYNILEDHEQRIANALLMLATIALPLLIIFSFWYHSPCTHAKTMERYNTERCSI